MTIADWLAGSMKKLGEAGVDSPRRDSMVLVEDILQKDRAWVVAHPEFKLMDAEVAKLNKLIERRIKREPLAYIRGKAWFYKRFFSVSPQVLIPRPESESIISLLKEIKPKYIDDVGTGSGCLAVTAALELLDAQVYAVDNDFRALRIARKNAGEHEAKVGFVHSDMLRSTPLHDPQKRAIIANLPYVPEGLITSPEIKYEPASSMFSGKDGLDHYKEFWKQVGELPAKPRYILTESLASQHKDLEKMAAKAGYQLEKTDGLVQQFELKSTG